MTERKSRRFYGVGLVSILMVFVVLCFTTFGVLSLVSARADMRLSQKNADNVAAYYTADAAAKKALAAAAEIIRAGGAPDAGYFTSEAMSCESLTDGGRSVTLAVAIGSDTAEAAAELRVSAVYDAAAGGYAMSEHRVIALEPDGRYSSQGTDLFDMGGSTDND